MLQLVRDREFRLALGVLYMLAMLFFSAAHLGGAAIADEGDGRFVQGIQLSICFGNGDAGTAHSASGICALCSLAVHGSNADVAAQGEFVVFVRADNLNSHDIFHAGSDNAVPPLRGPPVLIS